MVRNLKGEGWTPMREHPHALDCLHVKVGSDSISAGGGMTDMTPIAPAHFLSHLHASAATAVTQ